MSIKSEYIKLTKKNEIQIRQGMNYAKLGYKFLKEHVFNYTYTFFYEDSDELKKFTLNINNNDFAHLCGIEYKNGNKNFGKDLVDNRINWDKIFIKSDGTTSLKLAVIASIHLLFTTQSRIESGGRNLDLVYDKLLRTNKQILGLGCKQLSEEKLIPLSLLNLKTLNRNEKKALRYEIVCVIRKNKQTSSIELMDKVDFFDIEKLELEFVKQI
ncbi:PBECR4 domain-containing protein [Enterococcus faecalis]|uniref:PBECR4 domain-containing protein n=1 Tax=Enterococcus faecalis TaxID=1351 RepID=UPI001ECAEAD0|nr:hypothetical protein [Enterococcus faecalis]